MENTLSLMHEPVPYADDIEEALQHLLEAKVNASMNDEAAVRLSLRAVETLVRSAELKLAAPAPEFPPSLDGTVDIVDLQL